jgi:hypothetical protein
VAAEDATKDGIPVVWIVVFAVVFVALVLSSIVLLSADYLPARFVDVEQTSLVKAEDGTRLTLVLRHAPTLGQLTYDVRVPADGGLYVVEVRLSAAGEPAPREGEDDRTTLEVDLPAIERVRVVDLRWGRDEAVDITLDGAQAP